MDPRDQTFMTIHNLSPDANVLFASESVFDILGYTPDEVQGKSCFDYFHPDEVPFARSVHSRGVLLDKAAVLHYARIMAKNGRWVNCECCFTIVHDVLVACTSIYQRSEKSSRRAMEAPQIRRLFSSSPRDPRYHMLEHLSPKFKMPPMEREPRAALILNRFTRNLSIMFATNAVSTILGLEPHEIKDKAFYECIQQNCLHDAIQCLESAKANESIAYLRFWFRDPRGEQEEDDEEYDVEDEAGPDENDRGSMAPTESTERAETKMEMDDEPGITVKVEESEDGPILASPAPETPAAEAARPSPRRRARRRRQPIAPFELEAVVSCTSDGLVVVLRKARPPVPMSHPRRMPVFHYENGLFAAPWAQRPIEPYFPPELLYIFRPPLMPQYMPLREGVKDAGGPPLDQLMSSIRDVAVFAWALTGINGTMADYARGLPGGGAQPQDGLPVWNPSGGIPGRYKRDYGDRKGKSSVSTRFSGSTMRAGPFNHTDDSSSPGSMMDYRYSSHQASADHHYTDGRRSPPLSPWMQTPASHSSGGMAFSHTSSSSGYFPGPSQPRFDTTRDGGAAPLPATAPNDHDMAPLEGNASEPQSPGCAVPDSQAPSSSGSSDRLRHGWP